MNTPQDLSAAHIRLLQQSVRAQALETVLMYVRSLSNQNSRISKKMQAAAIRAAEVVCRYDLNGLTSEAALEYAIKIVKKDYEV